MLTPPQSAQGETSSRRPLGEIAAVAMTGMLHPVFVEWLHLRGVFIALAAAGWGTYIALRIRRDRSLLAAWGFSRNNLAVAFKASGLLLAFSIALLAGVAASRGALQMHWHLAVLLVVYPIWGLLQQFLVQGMFVRNVAVEPRLVRPIVATLLAACLFGVVHLPDLLLTAATFAMGLAFTPIYLKWRNLWPLGLCHGWLGALFYFWILRRDPWQELLQ